MASVKAAYAELINMITKNKVVTIHYVLQDNEGNELDSSNGKEPLVYLQGAQNIIVGLEEELEGKKVGDEVDAVIAPEKAYGVTVDALIQTVPREAFGDAIDDIEIGKRFQAETEQGPVPVIVTAMDEKTVTVDGNHPLAGKELHFKVNVSDIREASAEEIEHGHVHQSDGQNE